MSVNRLAEGYHPDFDIDAAAGHQGELFVLSIADALKDGTGEVKAQEAASKWGNVYTEYACLRRGQWLPSGIETTQAEFTTYTLGTPPIIAVSFQTRLLRSVHEQAMRDGDLRTVGRGSHPTRGTVISLRELLPKLLAAAKRDLSFNSREPGGSHQEATPGSPNERKDNQ